MRIAALIVAAGRGTRLGGDAPKQYQEIDGRSVLRRSIEALLAHPGVAFVLPVIHAEDAALYAASAAGLAADRVLPPATGAATRSGSVRRGLDALEAHAIDAVLIHDAARPFLSFDVTERVIAALSDGADAVCPGIPVIDALWRAEDGQADAPVDRTGLWRAQTPQGFAYAAILAAHRATEEDLVDDVAAARAAGLSVRMVHGARENYKITTPEDLERARRETGGRMDIRTGNGFDVHAFGEGDHVTLCGVPLPFERGLSGHSDADVGMHALTDAIFGALAEGDIGQWFPPSDPQWKGAASEIFLRKAMERAAARGFFATHLDCTLICEAPKIGPHAATMRVRLAEITGIAEDRISVKATTSERLGFTGRGEGIAALAIATLVRP